MVRLCTREDNVDMILAMRPYSRLQRVIRLLFENVQQVGSFFNNNVIIMKLKPAIPLSDWLVL